MMDDMKQKPIRQKNGRWRLAWSGAVLVGLLCLYGFYLWATLTLPTAEDHPPLLIYGAPFLLAPGMHIGEVHLKERLDRLGYHQVSRPIHDPGEYYIAPDFIAVYIRDYPAGRITAFPLRLVRDGDTITQLLSLSEGQEVSLVPLEPPLISGVIGASRQVRDWISLADLPPHVLDAILAVEDHRFYRHHGVDPIAIARAMWENLRRGAVVQGGSTITQQLAKNLYYSSERTLLRKFKETMAALVLENKFTKDEILESYVNEIYLGQAGSVAIYGVGEAAHRYFGKPVQKLTVAEAALLAGMIKAPNTYSPLKAPQVATKRRDLALGRLREEGKLSDTEWRAATKVPVRVAPGRERVTDAPYFVDYLLRHAEGATGSPIPPGAKVFTTLDPVLQRIAEETLQTGLTRLEGKYSSLRRKAEPVQGAVVALDPKTGSILAMVGGRDYRQSQFNRAVQARRQPGSLFKPFVYLAAFEAGRANKEGAITPATLIVDEQISFPTENAAWSPQNYDQQFRGPVTVRTALEQSLNVPTVRIAHAVGMHPIVSLARDLGIQGPLEENLTTALGTSEVSLLEITGAFGVLAQSGRFVSPAAVAAMVASTGESLWHDLADGRQVVSPEAAYLVTSLLQGVVERGTAAKVRTMGLEAILAGKTGTTDEYRDAWFVGYTPDLVIGVWVGFDDGSALGLSGSAAALPIWIELARQIIPSASPEFSVPSGVVTRAIDPETGQLATSKCPREVEETFIEGTEPTVYCQVHGGSWWDEIKQKFGL
jgi:1A family penicillin-binding protein